MGLDWCVEDRVVGGQETNHLFSKAQIERINSELDTAFKDYAKEVGEEIPSIFPNDLYNRFLSTERYKTLQDNLRAWQATYEECIVSPMETLGCPRVGIDEEATEWATKYYEEIKEKSEHKRFLDAYPTLQEYLAASDGKYVAELAKKKEGLGAITGIAVGAESFRGKIVGYIDWVSSDLKNRAYENQTAEELLEFGDNLLAAAESAEKEGLGSSEEVEDIKAAAKWCRFWGEHGHGMYAWY